MVDDMLVVNRHSLDKMPAVDFGRLCEWVMAEIERRDDEAEKAPWPDGSGRVNPNRGVVAKRIN